MGKKQHKTDLPYKSFLELPAESVSRDRFKNLVRTLEKEANYEKKEGRTLYFQFHTEADRDICMRTIERALMAKETAFEKKEQHWINGNAPDQCKGNCSIHNACGNDICTGCGWMEV
jgi:hypothetical protein